MRIVHKVFFTLLVFILITVSAASAADTVQPKSGILHTKDGIIISYDHYKEGSRPVIIVCPGFFNSKDNRWMRRSVEMLNSNYDVIIFDFRGHGKSTGKYTWSAKEYMDLDAVIDYAKSSGYKYIGILAFSLGAAVAVNEAAVRSDIDSMVLISCPSRFQSIDYCFWEPGMFSDLKDNMECNWQGKGAKFSNIFMHKEDPIDSIRLIKNTPLLFLQGDNDWVIKARHAKKLYDAAISEKKLGIIKDGLHAERLLQFHYDEVKDLVLDWFSKTIKS
ncbi:MAG: alpha/beta hydrolase [Candidatus Omnitrophota bacterium]|nr:alpha/beta hydrolase [Candidatus Omnitrophota bacterium]